MVEHKIEKCFYQIVDIFRPDDYKDEIGTVIRDGYVILSIAPCYYSFKDDNGKKGKKWSKTLRAAVLRGCVLLSGVAYAPPTQHAIKKKMQANACIFSLCKNEINIEKILIK